jgi:peptidyl-prolyl cis-trans isomerase B (cyclophilin B)
MIGRMIRATAPRFLLLLVLALAAALLAAGCGSDESSSDDGGSEGSSETTSEAVDAPSDEVKARDGMYDSAPTTKLDASKEYTVRLETSKGDIDIAVDPKQAPIAAANFVYLVEEGFYDGTTFHRIIEDFMIQAGDPRGDGTGGPGYTIKDEPVKGSYDRGVVAMARTPEPNSAGSQFFIVQGESVQLDPSYVIFGSVDEAGMEVVDAIAGVEVETGPSGEPSSPVEPVVIERATLVEPTED